MKPVIGIVICGVTEHRQYVSSSYIEAIEHANGLPVILPYISSKENPQETWQKYLNLCDGFLFCGGNDITPLLFGEDLLTEKGTTNLEIDHYHLEFMKTVLESSLPILGICRGMQVMNLALGGSLYQDLSLLENTHLNHMQISDNRSDISHKITISKNSILYNICGINYLVNSFHHQCIKKLGDGLRITAIASDGIIEAIELPSHLFALGVQWHPECMYHVYDSMKKMFDIFIEKSCEAKKIPLS